MLTQINTQLTAKGFLLLVCLVVSICLSQNSGWTNICVVDDGAVQDKDDQLNQKCQLTEQLLKTQIPSFEQGLIFVSLLLLLLWFWSARILQAPPPRDPIPPPRRRHLTFCVFRE